MKRVQIWSLARELRSHMLQGNWVRGSQLESLRTSTRIGAEQRKILHDGRKIPSATTKMQCSQKKDIKQKKHCHPAYLYAEYIMQNAGLDETQAGIKIARRKTITSDMLMTLPLWQKAKSN